MAPLRLLSVQAYRDIDRPFKLAITLGEQARALASQDLSGYYPAADRASLTQ